MNSRADLRPTVVAGIIVAVLAGAHRLAPWEPARVAPASGAALAIAPAAIRPDSVAKLATESMAESAPARPFNPADTVSGCLAGPLRFVRGSPASRRPLLVHRYVGTVGGQPATALLAWQNPDSVAGSFYLHRRGPAYTLTSGRHRPGYSVLDVFQENPTEGDVGEWRLANRPGSQLVGTWRGGPHGRAQAVVLHESYTGAVRLAIEATCLRGGWAAGYETGYAKCYNMPTVCHEFLRLLMPVAVPLALRPVLLLPPAARRRTTRATRSSEGQVEARLSVRLNDWKLLSYETLYTTALFPGYGTADYAFRGSPLFDLATGQVWPLGRLLQPGYQPALARLVARHLLHDHKFRDYEWSWARKPLSQSADDSVMYNTLWLRREVVPRPEAYVLTSEGLELTYHPCNLAENKSTHEWVTTVLVPYRELRPLLRPGAPLIRLLRARGM